MGPEELAYRERHRRAAVLKLHARGQEAAPESMARDADRGLERLPPYDARLGESQRDKR
jgi:hypothetical protein